MNVHLPQVFDMHVKLGLDGYCALQYIRHTLAGFKLSVMNFVYDDLLEFFVLREPAFKLRDMLALSTEEKCYERKVEGYAKNDAQKCAA